MQIRVNGQSRSVPADWHDETLLSVLRHPLGLTGTRLGCGQGLCGTCAVLVDGQPRRSCVLPVAEAAGRAVTTFEGLADQPVMAALRATWAEAGVPQCGYCQTGQMMAACALLARNPAPDDAAIEAALAGQLCRCGTQPRLRVAVRAAARRLAGRAR
jgi:isoquinoline 1-oxidoreductase alpha subunit